MNDEIIDFLIQGRNANMFCCAIIFEVVVLLFGVMFLSIQKQCEQTGIPYIQETGIGHMMTGAW